MRELQIMSCSMSNTQDFPFITFPSGYRFMNDFHSKFDQNHIIKQSSSTRGTDVPVIFCSFLFKNLEGSKHG